MEKRYQILLLFIFKISLSVLAQVNIKKSAEIRMIDGKEYYIHSVERGHTLYSIARVYNVSIKEINSFNPDTIKQLRIGQKLKIPVKNSNPILSISISQRQNVNSKSQIGNYVSNYEGDGQPKETKVSVINQELPPPKADEHIVKAGENLYRLAIKYKLSLKELKAVNPGLTERIYVGDRLKIPTKTKENNFNTQKGDRENKFSDIDERGRVEIQLVDTKVKEVMPGSSSNIVVMIVNNAASAKEVQLKISKPDSWNLLTDFTSFRVAKHSKKIKVLSFYIPESTKVGDDVITIDAYNRSDNEEVSFIRILVNVKARYAIEIKALQAPEYVFSGDSMKADFRIQNLSNASINIESILFNNQLNDPIVYTIAQDSFININVCSSTLKDILFYTRKSISLTAKIIEDPEISVTKSIAFDVIPTNKMKFDAFNRLPIKVTGLLISDNRWGDRKYGYMLDVSAKGMLSKKKERSVDIHLRLPNKEGNPLFGLTEEYYAKYSSPHINFVVGDNNYRLSDLTESSRYGRGVGLEYTLSRMMIGAYYTLPKFYPDVKSIYAVYSKYTFSDKFTISAGYLNKTFAIDSTALNVSDSSATLMSVSSELKLFNSLNMEVEYASGKTSEKMSTAYKASLRIAKQKYRAFVNYTSADIDFPGYFSNSKYLSSGISTSIIPNSNFSVNYEFNHSNLALDTLYSNAPLSTNLSFSGMLRIKKVHNLGFAVFMRKREDQLESKLFNYEEVTARFTLQNKLGKFETNAYAEIGKIKNLLLLRDGELTDIQKFYFSLSYMKSKNFSIDAFLNYQGGKYYQTNNIKTIYYGVSVNASLRQKLNVLLEYQSNYAMEEYYKDRSLLSAKLKFILNERQEFGFSANYNLVKNTLDNKELNFAFNYNHTLNLPISRKENIGSLKGNVINKGIGSIEGIAFTLAGNKVLSDKDGHFDFPVVKAGTYYLLMDYSNTGLNTIAEIAGPYRIEIFPGQTHEFEIALTRSAKIRGQITIQEDANKDNKDYIPVKEKLGNLIIEVSRGGEIYRMYSDKNGKFNFEDLRTGIWQLKIYKSGIPSGYQLVKNIYHIEVSSGQVKDIEVLVKKKTRKIKFQKTF